MISTLSQSQRTCHKMIRRLDKEKLHQLVYYNKVVCPSIFINTRNVHLQKRMPLHTNYNAPITTIINSVTRSSMPLLVRQFAKATETQPPVKKTGIIKKILKISLGSIVALLTTGGLLIAKNVYQDEDDPVSPDNLTAPGRKSEINKEWVEFMLTNYENRQRAGTKVTVNNFDVGDATQHGDGYAGEHVKLLVNATIQRDESHGQLGQIHDKDYNLFVKLLNPHPLMQQMFKHSKLDLNELLIYSDLMDDIRKFQTGKTNENVCFNTPGFVYGKWTDKQFVLVMENMKSRGYCQNPKEQSFNLHQAKLGLEQIVKLHAVSYAYHKEHNILGKYPSYDHDSIRNRFTIGFETLLDSSIVFLKGRGQSEEIIKKISSVKSKLSKKANEAFSYDSKIKCLVHSDCWNNNFLFKADKDENGHDILVESEKILMLDFQCLHFNTPIFDLCMFIYLNTTPQFRKEYLEELLIYYHSTFKDILRKLNCNAPIWTYEEFKSEFDSVFPWYLRFAFNAAVIRSEAVKDLSLGKSDTGPSGPMWNKIKAAGSKLLIPLFLHPVPTELLIGRLLKSIGKELIEDKNKIFCDLMFDAILEAEENGTFNESRY